MDGTQFLLGQVRFLKTSPIIYATFKIPLGILLLWITTKGKNLLPWFIFFFFRCFHGPHMYLHHIKKLFCNSRSVNFESKLSSHEFFQKTNKWIHFLLLCNVFLFFFWKKLKAPKKPFEITWPLGITHNHS